MNRVYNFSAGPSMLPLPVLERAQRELLDYNGTGTSVMEMSHRSAPYMEIIARAEATLRRLAGIPDNYKVLFLQGGASTQFAMVPLNLMPEGGSADYVNSGNFANLAIKEASRFGKVNVVGTSREEGYTHIPALDPAAFNPDASYFYITTNNTIYGTRYTTLPDTGKVPLVADMSSNILSEPMDFSKFGLVFAGAQKNIAPAGVTIVIVREDLLGHARESTPVMLNYKTHADKDSMYNTPPCYSIYIASLVFEWLESLGGLPAIAQINYRKAGILYDYLDSSKLFTPTAAKADRSIMNVTFVTGDKDLDSQFCKEAAQRGLISLKGHRSVGGMRASIYNAMPEEGVKALVAFMAEFEKNHQ